MSDWIFIEQDEDKICWWRLDFPETIDFDKAQCNCLCVWPEINYEGECRFDYGTTYEEEGYYEFEYCGRRSSLAEAKLAAEEILRKLPALEKTYVRKAPESP